jgi:hypothetical protein
MVCFLVLSWWKQWSEGVLYDLFYKGTNPIHYGSTLMTEHLPKVFILAAHLYQVSTSEWRWV